MPPARAAQPPPPLLLVENGSPDATIVMADTFPEQYKGLTALWFWADLPEQVGHNLFLESPNVMMLRSG